MAIPPPPSDDPTVDFRWVQWFYEVYKELQKTYSINSQTGTTYTPNSADADDVIISISNASANTITIPANSSVPYEVGTQLNFVQGGAGATTIAITTDTLNVNSNLTKVLNGQYAVASALKVAATEWVLFGNLVPA